ncbi:MAG: 16S rRNA (guanine(527)-N(7))-methyltransferase RsmG [Arcobacteraceae bacterium]|nr:16S rRNA (guanine(527)-N(7))-methyltransferase RsmG [Arcobacteraceae bacterium]
MLKAKLEEIGLSFDNLFYERCDKFIELLQQWGEVHNLTASLHTQQIKDNIIDSVYPLKFLDEFKSLLDVGTGAGYPGMLLAIAKPDVKVYLCEPRVKRVAFLNFVKNALKLENVTVIKERVENIKDLKVDFVTSRAVTNTALLLDLTKEISTSKTSYLFYKGSLCEEEIKQAQLDNYEVISVGEHRNYLYMKRQGLFDDI